MRKSTSPPKHLSSEARHWWRALAGEFDIEDEAGRLLLQTACESFDRMRAAQGEIERDGMTIQDRFGQQKPHPQLTTERDSRAAMLAALRALNLDTEPTRAAPGRPPGR